MLVRQYKIATQAWTPSVAFGVILHAIFGIAFIVGSIQDNISSPGYDRISHNNIWAVGIVFILLYVYALLFPVWGGLVAILVSSSLGFASALATDSIVGMIFYVAFPYVCLRTTIRRQHLLIWLEERRRIYNQRERGDE